MHERVMKYGLVWTELNNFKARLTEQLVKRYIEKVLIPELGAQGWDQSIYTQEDFRIFYDENESQRPKCKQGVWNNYVYGILIENGLYPTEEFINTLKKLTSLLKHAPDGYLFKFKKTGKVKSLKKHTDTESELLPIVNGEIEVVEVKTGKAIIPSYQMVSYCKVLEERYVLRFFHVNIISFEKNEFEIEEKLVTTPEELEAVQLQERKRGRDTKT